MPLSTAAAAIPLVPAGLDRVAHHRRDPAWLDDGFRVGQCPHPADARGPAAGRGIGAAVHAADDRLAACAGTSPALAGRAGGDAVAEIHARLSGRDREGLAGVCARAARLPSASTVRRSPALACSRISASRPRRWMRSTAARRRPRAACSNGIAVMASAPIAARARRSRKRAGSAGARIAAPSIFRASIRSRSCWRCMATSA